MLRDANEWKTDYTFFTAVQNGINGVFEDVVVTVNGYEIGVRGVVVNGEVRLGTFFVPYT